MRLPTERNGLVLMVESKVRELSEYRCSTCGYVTDARFSTQFWGAHDCIRSASAGSYWPHRPAVGVPAIAIGGRVPY